MQVSIQTLGFPQDGWMSRPRFCKDLLSIRRGVCICTYRHSDFIQPSKHATTRACKSWRHHNQNSPIINTHASTVLNTLAPRQVAYRTGLARIHGEDEARRCGHTREASPEACVHACWATSGASDTRQARSKAASSRNKFSSPQLLFREQAFYRAARVINVPIVVFQILLPRVPDDEQQRFVIRPGFQP